MQPSSLKLLPAHVILLTSLLASLLAAPRLHAQDMEALWARIDGGPGSCVPTNVAAFEDASSVAFGYGSLAITIGDTTLVPDLDQFSNWIARFNADGTVRWAVPVHLDGFATYYVGLGALPDGSTVFAGGYTSRLTLYEPPNTVAIMRADASGAQKGFIVRFDPDGKITQFLELTATRTDRGPFVLPRGLHAAADGTMTVTGRLLGQLIVGTVTLTSGSPASAMFVLHLDAQGNAVWGAKADATDYIESTHIDGAPNGDVFVEGFHNGAATFGNTNLPGGLYRRYLARYSSSGALLWARSAAYEQNQASTFFSQGLAVHADGSTVYCGWLNGGTHIFGDGTYAQTVQAAAGVGTAFLARYAPNGDLAWVRSTVSGTGAALGTAVLPDGDTILGGFFRQRLDFGGTNEPVVDRGPVLRSHGYVARFNSQGVLENVAAHDGTLTELQDVAVGGGRLVSATGIGSGAILVDGYQLLSTRNTDMMIVQRAHDWTAHLTTNFENKQTDEWLMSEEVFIPDIYGTGLGKLKYKSNAARTGKRGLRIIANNEGLQKSNIVIAYKLISTQYEDGIWRFSFHFRLPDAPEQKGQNAPTFTMQNTRFANGASLPTETLDAGFSYTVNPFDPGYQKWRIWQGGATGWTQLDNGPVLELGKWYKVTFAVDFTNLRYRSLVIEAPDDQQFQPYRVLLDQPVPSVAKGFGAESFTISVEAENQFVDFNANPTAAPTTFYLDVDDVTLHRAEGR